MGAPTFHGGFMDSVMRPGNYSSLFNGDITGSRPQAYYVFKKKLDEKLSESYLSNNEKSSILKRFDQAWTSNSGLAPRITNELIRNIDYANGPINAMKTVAIDSTTYNPISSMLEAFSPFVSNNIQQSPKLLGGNYINDINNGNINYNEFNDMRRKLGLGFGSREDEQIALAIKSAQLKRYHSGGISMEEQIAVLQKDEAIIPKNLVGALPEGILNRIPNGNIEARIGNKTNETVSNNSMEANIPVNIQMVTNGAGNMSTPEGVRNMIKKELENYNLLGAIMDAPVRMLNK
jgi:hypothetical protein